MPHPHISAGSKVISFPPLDAREKRVRSHSDEERGTILIFTGIRYERLEDDGAEPDGDDRPARRDDEIWL